MAMASPSAPSTWIFHSPKPEVISHFSLSDIYLSDSMRSRRRAQILLLVPKCSSSLHEESPPPPIVVKKMMRKVKEKPDFDSDLGSSVPLESAKTIPRPKRRRRSRIVLWKRIFFASKKVRSIILLNILIVIYASDIPELKEVEQIVDPALFTVVRFAVTAIPFLPFILKAREDCQTRSAGIELGLWVSLGYLSQALGLLTSEAGQASFISAFTIIVVPLIEGIFGATVPALTWTGALVSLVGVGILEYGGSPPCVSFVALSSAIWFVCRDMFSEVHQLNFGSVSWEWSAWWDWMVSFPWIPAIYTGVFSTGLFLWAEMDAMRDVSATEAAVIYGLEPVWGAAFAWFLLGERWDTIEWFGAVLVLCGSLTVQILGSPLESSSNKEGERSSNHNHSVASNNQNDFSLLTVVVKTKKNVDHLFKKQDKL